MNGRPILHLATDTVVISCMSLASILEHPQGTQWEVLQVYKT
jgi:hypothetical protein